MVEQQLKVHKVATLIECAFYCIGIFLIGFVSFSVLAMEKSNKLEEKTNNILVDQNDAKLKAFNKLSEREKCYIHLHFHHFHTNKENVYKALRHFAQLTYQELEKNDLMLIAKEDFEEKFFNEFVKE